MAVELEPLLAVDDIQGNILAGFNKDQQLLVGLLIQDVTKAKAWIRRIAREISTTREVLAFNRLFSAQRRRLGREPTLAAAWFNIAFSACGLTKLVSAADVAALPDAFRLGMQVRSASLLGDPVDPALEGHPSRWSIGGARPIDVLLIFAADREDMIAELRARILSRSDAGTFELVADQRGSARPDLPGHEHFGFKDGISQPAVRGRVSSDPEDFLSPRMIDPADPAADAYAKPGEPLIMPGHFVIGYDVQSSRDGTPLAAAPPSPVWMRDGSFLVFRRLRQDVAAFRKFVHTTTAELRKTPALATLTEGQFGALCVGRWANGAPIVRAPDAPLREMTTSIASNAFAFTNAMQITLKSGVEPDAVPPAPADPLGARCPFWSHIRKMNPRDDTTDLGDEFDTLVRRFLRRGIAYGPPLPEGAPDDGIDRGLLFLAYHASLEDSFEKVTTNWANTRVNPHPNGHDPIIGQNKGDPARSRGVQLGDHEVTMPQQFVIATGGEYLFSPSISALCDVLAQ